MKNQSLNNPARRRALLTLAGAGSYFALLQQALAANPAQGIRQMSGQVTIDGQAALIGQTILPGQTIKTGANSKVVFVVGNDAFMQHENSALQFEDNALVSTLRYLTGRILSVFGKQDKQLITPTATIGIRGTACYIEAGATLTYLCLCYGEIDLRANTSHAQQQIYRTDHHERPLYIENKKGKGIIRKAPMRNHTDAELELLEALVDRTPPFVGKGYSYY